MPIVCSKLSWQVNSRMFKQDDQLRCVAPGWACVVTASFSCTRLSRRLPSLPTRGPRNFAPSQRKMPTKDTKRSHFDAAASVRVIVVSATCIGFRLKPIAAKRSRFPEGVPASRWDFAGAEIILSIEKDHGTKPIERSQAFQPYGSTLSQRAQCKWLIPLAEWLVIRAGSNPLPGSVQRILLTSDTIHFTLYPDDQEL